MPRTAASPGPPLVRCARRSAPAVAGLAAAADFPSATEWAEAEELTLSLWSGAADPLAARRGPSSARLLWDERALHLRCEIAFDALCLDTVSPTDVKRHGLWEFDVVELFCSLGAAPLPYAELEAAPTGHWLDYLVEQPRRVVDRQWRSGMTVRGALGAPVVDRFTVEIAVPWRALPGAAPAAAGAELRANVYAAQGLPGARRFLALAPTATPEPDFHVPERFARLRLA